MGFLLARGLIVRYRSTVVARLKGSRWWTLWKSSTIYKWYQSYRSVVG